MATKIKRKNGKEVTLLNPSEKGSKFASELKRGFKLTNSGSFKLDNDKKGIRLNDKERAYRSGYLDARKDSANCWKSQKKKKG